MHKTWLASVKLESQGKFHFDSLTVIKDFAMTMSIT